MPIVKYICKGCDETYLTEDYPDFDKCSMCEAEVCVSCGKMIKGKMYCRDCKPVETNWYDRSVE